MPDRAGRNRIGRSSVAAFVLYLVISHPYRQLSPLGSVVVPLMATAAYAANK